MNSIIVSLLASSLQMDTTRKAFEIHVPHWAPPPVCLPSVLPDVTACDQIS